MAFSTAELDQPLGLQRLSELNSLELQWKRTWIGHKYEVRESSGELLFNSNEVSTNMLVGCDISLLDANDVEVIRLRIRNIFFCIANMEVRLQGALASIVQPKFTCVTPLLRLHDANDVPAYRLRGPRLPTGYFQFQLTTLDKEPLGTITRKWCGWRKDILGDANIIIINFPKNMDIKYKAACIGASIYIIRQVRRPN